MTTPEPVAELLDVHKAYGPQPVLRGVSVRLPAARTTAIVGASGSGKTTLLTLLNGLERPDQGQVRLFGEPIPDGDLAVFRRRCGYSVQGAGLFPHLTVRDNLCLVARLDGVSRRDQDERCAELMAAMELAPELAERYPAALSGGQQQRVGLARALMLKPPLLLLDEPFSAIDPITRLDIYALFGRTQAQMDISTVLVTHDMREAVRLAQHLVILKDGLVLQQGETATVLAAPADDYVERLVKAQL